MAHILELVGCKMFCTTLVKLNDIHESIPTTRGLSKECI